MRDDRYLSKFAKLIGKHNLLKVGFQRLIEPRLDNSDENFKIMEWVSYERGEGQSQVTIDVIPNTD